MNECDRGRERERERERERPSTKSNSSVVTTRNPFPFIMSCDQPPSYMDPLGYVSLPPSVHSRISCFQPPTWNDQLSRSSGKDIIRPKYSAISLENTQCRGYYVVLNEILLAWGRERPFELTNIFGSIRVDETARLTLSKPIHKLT